MALPPPANTDMATMQALDRTEERLGALIGQSEARTRAFVWNVVVGTGVVLSIATVGTLIGAGALLLDIVALI